MRPPTHRRDFAASTHPMGSSQKSLRRFGKERFEMTSVERVKVVDVSGIKSYGARAAVLLASSLGWNVVQKPNDPVTLIAKDGHRFKVPTDTSVKSAVYQSWISSIMTHSTEYTPTVKLVDNIVQIVRKLNTDEERRLRLAVGEDVHTHRARMAAMEEGPGRHNRNIEGPLTQRIEIPTPVEATTAEPEVKLTDKEWDDFAQATGINEPRLVSSKPLMTRAFKGRPSQEMAFVLEQTFSDGTTKYKCKLCDYTSDYPKSVNGHSKHHGARTPQGVKAKQERQAGREAIAKLMELQKSVDAGRVQVVEYEQPSPQEVEAVGQAQNALDIIDQIRELVGSVPTEELQLLREENAQLLEEIRQVQQRYDKMKADWDALKGLLGNER